MLPNKASRFLTDSIIKHKHPSNQPLSPLLSILFAALNNQTGSEVFSFVAPFNLTSFSHLDILPLFRYLTDKNKMPASTYLSNAQFGTETFHTNGKNVTFEASGVDLTIQSAKGKSSAASRNGFGWRWVLLQGAVG